jgi:hypothetical protein
VAIGVRAQLVLQIEELRGSVDLEAELIDRIPLVAAAGTVLPPEVFKGVEVREH